MISGRGDPFHTKTGGTDMLKKGDKLVILFSVVLIALSVLFGFWVSDPGERVVIKKNNEIVFEGKLQTDAEIDIKSNKIIIKDGVVFVEKASCKNQICVKHKKISKRGESIVCLPNKVTVEIK